MMLSLRIFDIIFACVGDMIRALILGLSQESTIGAHAVSTHAQTDHEYDRNMNVTVLHIL